MNHGSVEPKVGPNALERAIHWFLVLTMDDTTFPEATLHSLRRYRVENDSLRISVLPQVGAKVYDLLWKWTAQQFLWHNPGILPQHYPIDSNFDTYWCGGWDDIYPTADACEYKDETFANCAELRSLDLAIEGVDHAALGLSALGPISPVKARKRIALNGSTVSLPSSLENPRSSPLHFLWGIDPSLAVRPRDRLSVPAENTMIDCIGRFRRVPSRKIPYPVNLAEAVRDTRHTTLLPGQICEARIRATI
jgi:hypothetical protein